MPIGQIRFDLNENSAWEIDYSIDKNFRGLGYGKTIVKIGVEKLSKMEQKPKIIAKVKSTNISSIMTFRNLGFHERQEQNYVQFRYK